MTEPRGQSEIPVVFPVNGETVRGVWHLPAAAAQSPIGIVFLHGWSGSRTGPHRMFVKAARQLTDLGCHCLRFDFRGRGDSDGQTGAATIQSMIGDAKAAVAFLREKIPGSRILLLGICSGGKVAIGTAADTPGIAGLVLWSAEAMGRLRPVATNLQKAVFAMKEYLRKLRRPETWWKMLTGKVNVKLVNKALFHQETPTHAEAEQENRILERFRNYPGRILFIYGSNDPETRLAAAHYREFCGPQKIAHEFHEIPGANHSFYSLDWERQVLELTENWVKTQDPGGS